MFRKDSTEMAEIDINNLIKTVLGIVRVDLHRKQIEVHTELSGSLPVILGDKVQLQQVVLNLVMNASEAMQSVPRRVLTVRSEQSKPRSHWKPQPRLKRRLQFKAQRHHAQKE